MLVKNEADKIKTDTETERHSDDYYPGYEYKSITIDDWDRAMDEFYHKETKELASEILFADKIPVKSPRGRAVIDIRD